MTVRDQVAQYIGGLAHEDIPDHSMNLFESGILTSLDVLDIICFIEDTFKVDISDDDVDMQSFGSINGIVHLVEKSA